MTLPAFLEVTPLGLQALSAADFDALQRGAEIIEADHKGIRVLSLADGSFLKMVRRKGFPSSAWLLPYAMRFALNARRLAALGIICPQVLACYRSPALSDDIIHYQPVPGRTLRAELERAPQAELLAKAGAFIARLHETGIFFRALHLGNIVVLPDGALALIDIADVRFARRSLPLRARRKNIANTLRYAEDRQWLLDSPLSEAFWQGYAAVNDELKREFFLGA